MLSVLSALFQRAIAVSIALAAALIGEPFLETACACCTAESLEIAAAPPLWLLLKPRRLWSRVRVGLGQQPLCVNGGWERGLPAHRHYLEQFLAEHAADIGGRVLEFENDDYASRFAGDVIAKLDIIHVDHTNPSATIVADLTKPNAIPSCSFDCIICTHVLHVIYDFHTAIAELHRILKPDGVLLAATSSNALVRPGTGELWRFTPHGLRLALEQSFGRGAVQTWGFGNSLAAAGELRGLAADDFSAEELGDHDERFAIEVCARAVKARI